MSEATQVVRTQQQWQFKVGAVVLIALVVRLTFVLFVDPVPAINGGGDSGWLLAAGRNLFNGTLPVGAPAGPVYLVFGGILQLIFGTAAPQIIRVLNAVMGAVVCGFIAEIGNRYFSPRVGILAALIIAFDPTFIIESGLILTESVFVFFLFGALALYAISEDHLNWRNLAAVGALFGLASLTRATGLAFPLLLVIHLFYRYRRPAFRLAGILLLAYGLVLSTWTIYNLIKWDHFVIGADGLIANVYLGTTDNGWCGATCVDKQLGVSGQTNIQEQYAGGILSNISSNLSHYLVVRLSNLASSLLQPHNTEYYPGISIKEAMQNWWATGHSIKLLGSLTMLDNFWPKLALYIFHFGALILGTVGMILSLRQFGRRIPVYGIVGYFLALHLALTAVPRYLFPAESGWILFASFTLDAIFLARALRLRDAHKYGPAIDAI